MSKRSRRNRRRPPKAKTINSVSDLDKLSPLDRKAFLVAYNSARAMGCQCTRPNVTFNQGTNQLQVTHEADCIVLTFGNVDLGTVELDTDDLPPSAA